MLPVRILTFSTLYPSAAQPTHGIFVETRLRKLVEGGAVQARVVAPCPWFPFSSARFGGYSAFARTPVKETRHGIAVDHPRYPLLPKIGMNSAPLGLFAAVLPLLRRQLCDGGDFDLIDAHYFYPDGVAAMMLGRSLGRPVVITARGDDLDLIATHALPRRWIQWAARHAAGLITVSSGLKRRLEALGVASERIVVLRNGVDLAAFNPRDREVARQALGFTRPTLLGVGNLVAKKRHSLILEALPLLPDVDLVIVGEGPERPRLQALAGSLGITDRVRLLGRKPQESLPEIYSAADLLVHPSSRDGWPNVLLESMACGTAVVVTDFGGVSDIVAAPEAGRILAEPTRECMASTVHELLAELPRREATVGYAKSFSWDSTTEGQIALFGQIAEGRQSALGVERGSLSSKTFLNPAGERGNNSTRGMTVP